MSKADEFRKRNRKLDALNSQQNAETNLKIFQMLLDVLGKMKKLEDQMKDLFPKARIAEWRSLAIMRLCHEKNLLTEQEVVEKGNQLMIEDFQQHSDADDKARSLITVQGPAEDGMYAILNLKVYKDGQELQDQEIPRSKIEIGKVEQFPELDAAVRGMNVGETKRFPLKLMQQTDEGQVVLLGLRQAPKPAKEGVDGTQEQDQPSQQ